VFTVHFSNAFNCLHRSDMLKSIADRVSELLPYCYLAYANASELYYCHMVTLQCDKKVPSKGSIQSFVLFNTIHPLLELLGSILRLGYMDDVTLGGCQETVAKDVQTVTKVGHDMGLNINISKCEIIADPACICYQPITVVLSRWD